MLISSTFVDRGRDIAAMHVSVQKSPVSDMSGQRMNCQRQESSFNSVTFCDNEVIARRTLQEGGDGGEMNRLRGNLMRLCCNM
jgi:hypothetical protein